MPIVAGEVADFIDAQDARPAPRPSRPGWAERLTRVFGMDGRRFPGWGARMSLRTLVEASPSAVALCHDARPRCACGGS
jgi:hypothetical protein